jgi:excinuclease ABC subunit A
MGACPVCDGYGKVIGIDEELVIPDKTRTVYDDAIACWRGESMRIWRDELVMNASKFSFPIHRPYYNLTKEEKGLLWLGNEYFKGLNQFFQYLESEKYKVQYRVMLSRYTGKTVCPQCGGARLRKEALYVKIGGLTIADMVVMSVERLAEFFEKLQLNYSDGQKSSRLMVEIRNRLGYLCRVGLGYLTLDRLSSTLSGGESQRINLSTSLGSSLVGSLYILDEPSIGLHPRDTNNLIGVLKQLRDLGNTVIVVEHEEEVIRSADRIVDIGPLAGYKGGEVVFNGTLKELEKATQSLTSDYLFGRKRTNLKDSYRAWSNHIGLLGAPENNLK